MPETNIESQTLGFISVIENESEYFGGLLVLNQSGRPLEFHCTAPVKPTRSHEVLFGDTLRSFVLADSIAPTLIANTKNKPGLFCSDCIELLDIDSQLTQVVWIGLQHEDERIHQERPSRLHDPNMEINAPASSEPLREIRAHQPSPYHSWRVGGQLVTIKERQELAQQEVNEYLTPFARLIDLSEPFDRIHDAIRESHGIKSSQIDKAA